MSRSSLNDTGGTVWGAGGRSRIAPESRANRQGDSERGRPPSRNGRNVGPGQERPAAKTCQPGANRRVTVRAVLAAVAARYGVPLDWLQGRRHHRTLTRARGVAVYLARRLTSATYARVGESLGGRHHTTVMAAWSRTVRRLKADDDLRAEVDVLAAALGAAQ